MSRHRAVRNLDLDEELAEDDYDQDPYADITAQELEDLTIAMSSLQEVLGAPQDIGFTEREMKDSLWDTYFDVDQAVAHLLEERDKRSAKEKKKAHLNGEGDPDAVESPEEHSLPISAMQRLALARRGAQATSVGSEVGRAKGLAGLATRGRSGLAKRGLARLAPEGLPPARGGGTSFRADQAGGDEVAGLPQKRPAFTAQPGAAPAKMSKLAALSAARATASTSAIVSASASADAPAAVSPTVPVSETVSKATAPSGKPLSKLQLRMQAKQAAHKLGMSSAAARVPTDSVDIEDAELADVAVAPMLLSEKEAARKQNQSSGTSTPVKTASKPPAKLVASTAASAVAGPVSQLQENIGGLGIGSKISQTSGGVGNISLGASSSESTAKGSVSSTPKVGIAQERIIEEFRRKGDEGKGDISLVVVGHVDAGKSTLMGKLLHELGTLSDREHNTHERASQKIGMSSFAYAWALDSSEEERERGVTIDIAQDSFDTPHRHFNLLDAPGHRDFIPNMISGAAQADAALLVVDSINGAFEAGFGPDGQTREHALLLRALGVQQLIVVVNKMDAAEYNPGRFEEIEATMRPFLASSGFDNSRISFLPCGAAVGENLTSRTKDGALETWYTGPTLVDLLDKLELPARQLDGPVRMPISNVFRSQSAGTSGVGISGRLVCGIIQIGDRLRVVPGEESGVVRAIEQNGETVPWAVAGASITAYVSGVEQMSIGIGGVLCAASNPIPLSTLILAQILVFSPAYPLVQGTSLELYQHSAGITATLVELVATLDKSTGAVVKKHPRVLSAGSTAQVRIKLQAGGAAGQSAGHPIEEFKVNKEMARILLRRDGETVAAGIVLECST